MLKSETADVLRRQGGGNTSYSSGDLWLEGESHQVRIIRISSPELISGEGFGVKVANEGKSDPFGVYTIFYIL